MLNDTAGTALDIPNLTDVIQTIAIDSEQANKQSLGRLRDLSKVNKNVTFYYIYSGQIRQHKNYNQRRLDSFKNKAKSFKFVVYNNNI